MASIHRMRRSPYWYAAFYGPNGERCLKSTKQTSRRAALKIAMDWDQAARLGREGRLTESRVRSVMADIFFKANKAELPNATLEEFLESWSKRKSLEVSESSAAAYQRTCLLLKTYLPNKIKNAVDSITLSDAVHFRDKVAATVSHATANKNLKIARVIWGDAVRDGLTQDNPFAKVKRLRAISAKRRAFSLDELRRILSARLFPPKGG